MRRFVFAVLIFLASAPLSAQNQVSVSDIKRIAEAVRKHEASDRLLSWKGNKKDGWQVVFVQDGTRYTIYAVDSLVSFWVRLNGTSESSVMVTFSDGDSDGLVDFGIWGGTRKDSTTADLLHLKYFHYEKKKKLGEAKNLQFMTYWQEKYSEAVQATLKFYAH